MYTLLTHLARILPLTAGRSPVNNVAHSLMERADAGAGRDPHQAQELRSAASAFLSVVR